ncbi:hypothetical protein ACFLWA_00065 [Chloroflexota bacterium]
MNEFSTRSNIASLQERILSLPAQDRKQVERIFHISTTRGETVPPEAMDAWIAGQFGSVQSVREQQVVKVTNRVTMEGAVFNALRASRPIDAPEGTGDLEDWLAASESSAGGPFCDPERLTPADSFGRIRGKASLTASNVAKYDGWHGVVIFDEHAPLQFTCEQVSDYLDTAQAWARAAHRSDPDACYPFFLWNCLWRSGASIIHGHAQMTLTRGMHYARVEGWRQAATRYGLADGAGYFPDLVAAHRVLGLAVQHGTAAILPSLTPFKEMETYIISPGFGDDLKSAIYRVLHTFVERLGTRSFNLGLYQPPLCPTSESWEGFPFVARVLDRGRLDSRTSDIGAMEIFAQSVVSTDPYLVADALRLEPGRVSPATGSH